MEFFSGPGTSSFLDSLNGEWSKQDEVYWVMSDTEKELIEQLLKLSTN